GAPPVTFTGAGALTLQGGSGNDTYAVDSTAAGVSLAILAGSGNDAFVMTPASQFLDHLQGAVTIAAGAGSNTLVVDDQNDPFDGDTYAIAAGSIQRNAAALISYSGVGSVILNGSSTAAITYDVNGTAAGVPLTINAGANADTANLGGGNLDGLA